MEAITITTFTQLSLSEKALEKKQLLKSKFFDADIRQRFAKNTFDRIKKPVGFDIHNIGMTYFWQFKYLNSMQGVAKQGRNYYCFHTVINYIVEDENVIISNGFMFLQTHKYNAVIITNNEPKHCSIEVYYNDRVGDKFILKIIENEKVTLFLMY